MTRNDLDYLNLDNDFDREEESQTRTVDPNFKKRRRPEYCKKRTPSRSGMSQRNNWRRSR